MTVSTQLTNLGEIEKRLWSAADTLRSNSSSASNEYFIPFMGLLFLRHAYHRYLIAKVEVEKTLPKFGGKTKPAKPADYSQHHSMLLHEESQFDYLANLPYKENRASALEKAMTLIKKDYPALVGQLPKEEYKE